MKNKKKTKAANKKVLYLCIVAAVLLAAIVLLIVLWPKTKSDTDAATSTVTTATQSRETIVWTHSSTEAEPSTTETSAEETANTTASPASSALPDRTALLDIGVAGGGCYYAVGYKAGDEETKALVAAGIRRLEESGKLKTLTDAWFVSKVYPRDEKHEVFGHSNEELIKKFEHDGLKIGVIDGNAPVASFKDRQAVGFEIDVAKACFELYRIEPEFVAVTAENAAEKLNSGEIDLVWGGLRDGVVQGIDYSEMNEWNLENEMCYYTTSGSRYKGETALLDKVEKMGVVKGTLCADFIKDRLKTAGYDIQITEFDTARDAFAALGAGDVNCVACDYLAAYAMWKKG